MIVDSDVLERARKGNLPARIEVLAAQYPSSFRIAYGISGRADVGSRIVTHVFKQSFRAIRSWNDLEAPQRWFRHHTLLLARIASRWKPEPDSDTLGRAIENADGSYLAFVRSLRALPRAQMEAFLLRHGEELGLRDLAVTMDCSTTAAQVHLREADERMKQLAGDRFEELSKQLKDEYLKLTPSKDLAVGRIETVYRRHIWPRRIARAIRILFLLGILAALLFQTWRYWPQIATFVRSILSRFGVA